MSTSGTYSVYKVTNQVNGKFYIGITGRSLDSRWKGHVSRAKGNDRNTYFINAIRKYGEENFKIESLFLEPSKKAAQETEILLILDLCPKYNSTFDGEVTDGFKHSEETRKVLSEIGKKRGGPKLTEEQKKKAADNRRGKKMSDQGRLNISLATKGRISPNRGKPSPLKGCVLSKETKLKQSEAKRLWWAKKREENGGVLKGRPLTDEEKKNLSEKTKLRWQKIKQEQA